MVPIVGRSNLGSQTLRNNTLQVLTPLAQSHCWTKPAVAPGGTCGACCTPPCPRRRRYRTKPGVAGSSGPPGKANRTPNAGSVSQNPRRCAFRGRRNHGARPKPVKPFQGLSSLRVRYPDAPATRRPRALLSNASGVKAQHSPSAVSECGPVPTLEIRFESPRQICPHTRATAGGCNIGPRQMPPTARLGGPTRAARANLHTWRVVQL